MEQANISELDELKLIYFEILEGYSYDAESELYAKHFTDHESHLILQKRIELFKYYSKEGVPHEADLLKTALENEEWTEARETRILEIKYAISDNEKNLTNLMAEQVPFIRRAIEANRKELADLLFEKKHVLGRNIEDLIDEDVNDFVVYLSFYKDKDMTIHVEKTYEDFQLWEPKQINELNTSLAAVYSRFAENNIKGIACLPMFLNKLSYSKENITTFLGKSVSQLSHHQSFLFSLGLRNLNTLNNAKGSPPDLNLDAKISDLINWYDFQYSLNISTKNKQE